MRKGGEEKEGIIFFCSLHFILKLLNTQINFLMAELQKYRQNKNAPPPKKKKKNRSRKHLLYFSLTIDGVCGWVRWCRKLSVHLAVKGELAD